MIFIGTWDHFYTKTSILQNLKKSCTIGSVQFENILKIMSLRISSTRLFMKKKRDILRKKIQNLFILLRRQFRKILYPKGSHTIPSSFILDMNKNN